MRLKSKDLNWKRGTNYALVNKQTHVVLDMSQNEPREVSSGVLEVNGRIYVKDAFYVVSRYKSESLNEKFEMNQDIQLEGYNNTQWKFGCYMLNGKDCVVLSNHSSLTVPIELVKSKGVSIKQDVPILKPLGFRIDERNDLASKVNKAVKDTNDLCEKYEKFLVNKKSKAKEDQLKELASKYYKAHMFSTLESAQEFFKTMQDDGDLKGVE